MSKVQSSYSIGKKISKVFDGIEYSGKIVRDNDRYHYVEYKNGDDKDMTHTKIKMHTKDTIYGRLQQSSTGYSEKQL